MAFDISATLGLRVESGEVAAGAQQIDKLTTASGRAEAATEKLATATRANAQASTEAYSSLRSMAEAVAKVEKEELAAYSATRSQTEALKAQSTASRAYAADLKDVDSRIQALAGGQRRLATAHAQAAAGAKLQSHELMNAGRQAADLFTGLASGQGVMMVLVQQGPQIADIFATAATRGVTLKSALAGIAAELGPVAGIAAPFIAIGGAIVGVTMATYDYTKAQNELELATYGVGRATGLTADEIGNLAEAQASSSRLSISSSEKMTESYISLGVTGVGVLRNLNAETADFAAATRTDAETAVKRLAAALVDPERGVDDLAKAVGGFDGASRQAIITMARQNDLAGAQAAMMKIVAQQTRGAANEIDGMSGALRDGGNAWSNFWRDVGRGGSQFFTQFKGEQVSDAFSGFNPQLETGPSSASVAAKAHALAAQAQEDSLATADAYKALLPKEEQINKVRADRVVIERALASGSTALARAGLTEAQAKAAIAAADKKIHDLGQSDAAKKATREAESAARAAKRREEALAREAAAMEASTKSNFALAAAYGESDAAAMKAEATGKATAAAITKRGDVEAFVARQLRANVAEQAATSAKAAADLQNQANAQADLNDKVAAGVFNAAEAAEEQRDALQRRPLLIAIDLADAKHKDELRVVLERLTKAQHDSNDQAHISIQLAAQSNLDRQVEMLAEEGRLIGVSNRQRAIALAQKQKEQEILARAGGDITTDASKKEIATAGQVAGAANDNQTARQVNTGRDDGESLAVDAARDAKRWENRVDRQRAAYDKIAEMERQGVLTHEQAERSKADIDHRMNLERLSYAGDFFGNLASLSNSHNRKLAAIGKAAAIAQATIDTYAAATASYKAMAGIPVVGPALGAAAAAAAVVAGLANVAAITSTKGYRYGGYTGDLATDQVAGVVHGREYVFDAPATARIGVRNLDALRSGRAPQTPTGLRAANDQGSRVAVSIVPSKYFDAHVEEIADGVARPLAAQARDEGAQTAMAGVLDQYRRSNLRRLA